MYSPSYASLHTPGSAWVIDLCDVDKIIHDMKHTALLLLWSQRDSASSLFARRNANLWPWSHDDASAADSVPLISTVHPGESLSRASGRWRGRAVRDNRPPFPHSPASRLDMTQRHGRVFRITLGRGYKPGKFRHGELGTGTVRY
ncbi:hypothetical protein GGI35DRAFT_332445 [Trichoderma velutinum]